MMESDGKRNRWSVVVLGVAVIASMAIVPAVSDMVESDGTGDVTVVDCGEYEVYVMDSGPGAPDVGTELCSEDRAPVTAEDEDREKERVVER